MPTIFRKNFWRCVVIIDCFKVFLELPWNPTARAQTWSNYNHYNTVKFLVGIAPQGAVTCISRGWGGRVSDVHLTENCGLLNNLSHGDLVLADRGFTIDKSIGFYCAKLTFTRGKPQLTKSEVDFLPQLSHVCIHIDIERVIGMIRQKYKLLESTIPITFVMTNTTNCVSTLNKIVYVCCVIVVHLLLILISQFMIVVSYWNSLVVSFWNSLPQDIVNSPSPNSFKTRLFRHLFC